MRRKRSFCLGVKHIIAVAVVSREQCLSAYGKNSVEYLSHAFVGNLNGFLCRLHNARMSYHIAVGKIEYHYVVLSALDNLASLVAYLIRAHLGLHIESSNLRRVDKYSVFVRIGSFYAAVEEKCYVRILLSFGNSELLDAFLGEILAESVGIMLFLESHLEFAFESSIVSRKGYKERIEPAFLSLKARKVFVYKASRNLSCSVGTVVEEYNAVALADCYNGFSALGNYGRQHKFVGYALVVAVLHSLDGVALEYAFAVNERSVSLGNSVPYIISVHSVKSTAYSSDFTVGKLFHIVGKLLNKALTAYGRYVSSVHKAMYVYLLYSLLFSHFYKSEKMLDMRVYATVGYKTHYVEILAVLLCLLHSVYKRGIREEITVFDSLAYLGQILKNNSARTDIEVAYLAVAHLSFGQTYCKTARIELSRRIFLENFEDFGRSLGGYGVVLAELVDAVSVHYYQTCKFHIDLFGIKPNLFNRLYFST